MMYVVLRLNVSVVLAFYLKRVVYFLDHERVLINTKGFSGFSIG